MIEQSQTCGCNVDYSGQRCQYHAPAEQCLFGTKLHDRRDHYGRGWPHNPWSSACHKNSPGDPTCTLAYCPTCEPLLHEAAKRAGGLR